MKKLYFLILFTSSTHCFTQSISKEVIASSGGYLSNNTYSLNVSYGESIINNMSSENGAVSLSNGFHFVSNNTSLSAVIEDLALSLSIYPNPTLSHVNIISQSLINLRFEIYDINGKLISKDLIKSNEKINMNQLSSGVYLLKILTIDNKNSKVFRIIEK